MFGGATICCFDALPPLSDLIEDESRDDGGVVFLPCSLGTEAEKRLGLPTGGLSVKTEALGRVSVPNGEIPVYLAEFTAIDPPFEAIEAAGGKFIAITEARAALPDVEMLLLRRAYEAVMG